MRPSLVPTFLVAAIVTAQCVADSLRIDWYKISGGASTSDGGVYKVDGAIGLVDAGTVKGGKYVLTGGFWSAVALVQMPGVPQLAIQSVDGRNVMIFWTNGTSCTLQSSDNIHTPAWMDYPMAPIITNGTTRVILPASVSTRFFRLRQAQD